MVELCYLKILLFAFALGNAVGDINNSDGKNEFRSDYTYYPHVGYWFKANPIPVDWHTARLLCHYEGAELASPLTADILTVIKQIVAEHEPKLAIYFSGVHQTFGYGVYTSIEGVPLEKLAINNWAEGEPNGFNRNQQCLVYSKDGTIWDYNCPEFYPFICYRKYSEEDKLTECGTIDKAYQLKRTGHCYKYHKHASTWDRALKICRAEGGYLSIINTRAEAEVVTELVRRSPRPYYSVYDTVAVGFREWGEIGAWWTVNGQTLEEAGFEDWKNNYPVSVKDISNTNQSCGGLIDEKLDRIYCDKPYAFVCEKTKYSLTNVTMGDI